MREIRTYGLMRGCWPERFVRRVGVYSTGLQGAVEVRGECSGELAVLAHAVLFDATGFVDQALEDAAHGIGV